MTVLAFSLGTNRYRCEVISKPRAPSTDPSRAWWYVSRNDGLELPVVEAGADDIDGPELRKRLADAYEVAARPPVAGRPVEQ